MDAYRINYLLPEDMGTVGRVLGMSASRAHALWSGTHNTGLKLVDANGFILAAAIYQHRATHIILLAFATRLSFRRQGHGKRLLSHVLEKLDRTRHSLFVFVPDTNLPGHLFLRSMGFRAEECIRGVKCDSYKFRFFYGWNHRNRQRLG